jgi:hypothetical protein
MASDFGQSKQDVDCAYRMWRGRIGVDRLNWILTVCLNRMWTILIDVDRLNRMWTA